MEMGVQMGSHSANELVFLWHNFYYFSFQNEFYENGYAFHFRNHGVDCILFS
jgi:hypothetical protein